jgi:hypothetical protein
MRARPASFGALWCALALMAACGGGAARRDAGPGPYLDPAYQFDPMRWPTLAIVPPPLQGDLGPLADRSLELVFTDTPGLQLTGFPSAVRLHMQGDRDLVDIMSRLQSPLLEPSAAQPAPKLAAVLALRDLIKLRQKAAGSDLLLVPGDFEWREAGGRTHSRVRMRVFDLRDGALVMQDMVEAEVAQGGDALGETILSLQKRFTTRLLRGAADPSGTPEP